MFPNLEVLGASLMTPGLLFSSAKLIVSPTCEGDSRDHPMPTKSAAFSDNCVHHFGMHTCLPKQVAQGRATKLGDDRMESRLRAVALLTQIIPIINQ